MSRKEFEKRMLQNMEKLKILKDVSAKTPFENIFHTPNSSNLPKLQKPNPKHDLKDDVEELKLLKRLIIEKDLTTIPQLCKYRNIDNPNITRTELLNDYNHNGSYYSKFRVNKDHQVSYNCGYYYNIDESIATILDLDTEPVQQTIKIFSEDLLKRHHVNNSVNIMSCNKLQPNYVTFHIPNK